MIRNAMWRRVELVARDDLDGLIALERAAADRTDPPREVVMTRSAWDAALEDYYAEHDEVRLDADARGPALLRRVEAGPVGVGRRAARLGDAADDPRPGGPPRLGDRGAIVDLDASDEAGELVLATARCAGWAAEPRSTSEPRRQESSQSDRRQAAASPWRPRPAAAPAAARDLPRWARRIEGGCNATRVGHVRREVTNNEAEQALRGPPRRRARRVAAY